MVLFGSLLLVCFVYVAVGLWQWKKYPREITLWIGYRTSRAMKSQSTWDFAQPYSGRLMIRTGLILMLTCLPLIFVPEIREDRLTDGWLIFALFLVPTLVGTIIPVYFTERKLKQLFDNEGNPKKII